MASRDCAKCRGPARRSGCGNRRAATVVAIRSAYCSVSITAIRRNLPPAAGLTTPAPEAMAGPILHHAGGLYRPAARIPAWKIRKNRPGYASAFPNSKPELAVRIGMQEIVALIVDDGSLAGPSVAAFANSRERRPHIDN